MIDTQKLRQRILDLAIRGKLVPQDPNDEPASVLLERIRAEKERLIAEGKIKRPKKSKASSAPSHYQNFTPPFEIPDSWEWVTIADICSKIGSGSTPKGSNYSLDGIPFFRSQNVYNEGLVYTDIKYISEITHKSMISTEVIAGDLLLNITGGSLGRCTVVPDNFSRGNVSQHVCILRPIFVLPHFFHCLILSFYFKKAMNLTGSGREGLPKYNLEIMNFPLPPIEEQKRIVATVRTFLKILNLLDSSKASLCDEICKAKSKILDLAMQGKLVPQDPADEPAADMLLRINPKAKIITDNPHSWNIPKGWCWVKVSDVFSPMKRKLPEGDNFCYIDIDSIDNKKNIAYPKNISTASAPSRASRFTQKGDVVFSMVRPYLRNIALVPENDCIASTGFYVFHPLEVINSKFSYILTLSSYFVDGLNSYMKGDNSPSINKDNVESFVIPLPPRNEQQRIVAKIEKLYSALNVIEASLQS